MTCELIKAIVCLNYKVYQILKYSSGIKTLDEILNLKFRASYL